MKRSDTAERLEDIIACAEFHPGVLHLLKLFRFDHLPDGLKDVSVSFAVLALEVATNTSNIETTVALRKLLEAKDAAVRAVVIG